jgi:hypothetical protein
MSDPNYDRETGEIFEPPTPVVMPRMQPLASQDTTEVCTALAKAQGEFEAPKRIKTATIRPANGGQGYSYSYAPLEEIVRAVQKPLAENGLSRQQYLVSRDGQWFIRTIIWHSSGQWISSDYPVFAEAMTAQKFASGCTYAKRQGLSLALGLAPEDDDDANVADAQTATTQARDTAQRASRPNGPSAPPADERRAEVLRRHRELGEKIDKSQTIPEIDEWLTSLAWKGLEELAREVHPSTYEGPLRTLRERGEARKKLLLGDNDPMTIGETG